MFKKVSGKGIHLGKGESALDEIRKRTPHWVHDTKENPNYINGVMYLPSCTCSRCGYHSNKEKEICPGCGQHMHIL